ncbi:MAG: Sb-PDE family phosphodiesterase [Mangrovibacterium sp.]
MRNISLFLGTLLILQTFSPCSRAQERKEIALPDILGYQTLKCDFHVHTVFSDGDVWPTTRVQEAWLEGLDAIAITDHIEYRPHAGDIEADHNRAYEIAKPLAEQLGIILVRGTEISREMPPGHLSALFIKNANLLEREAWWEACVEARDQGAFVIWNHPGRKAQQPDTTRWWPEHSRLTTAGIMRGIELYNGQEYYPEVLKWADEQNLTVFAASDLHTPSSMLTGNGQRRRPLTLVFTADRSEEALRQALDEGRTAACFGDTIIGQRRFLSPIFLGSLKLYGNPGRLKNHGIKTVRLHNASDISFLLTRRQPPVGFSGPEQIRLKAHSTVLISLEGISEEVASMSSLKLFYTVRNLISLKGEPLPVNLEIPNR